MSAALKCVVESRGNPLTTDFIIHLHTVATEGVLFRRQKMSLNGWGIPSLSLIEFKPSLRTAFNTPRGFGFGYDKETSTPEGLAEIKIKYKRFAETDRDRYESLAEEYREGGFSNRLYILDHTDILKEMNIIIDRYSQSQHTNLDIAIFAHEMNLLHPFTDANIRLITFLLVNKLLIDEGRSPIIFVNPNIFDAFSCKQLGEFIELELQLSGTLCQDLNDPFGLNEQHYLLGRHSPK